VGPPWLAEPPWATFQLVPALCMDRGEAPSFLRGKIWPQRAIRPRKNNFSATDVAQTLSLPRPDSSGRALEHARQASR